MLTDQGHVCPAHVRIIETVLCLCISELKEEVERVQAQYRTEKQKRKEMELRVNNMEEEVQDLKTDKESLERVSMLHNVVLMSVKVDFWVSMELMLLTSQ